MRHWWPSDAVTPSLELPIWRFRLQWIVACILGFLLSGIVTTMAWETLQIRGTVGVAISVAIFLLILGMLQARVLDRSFRRAQWVIYGIAGTVLATLIVVPWITLKSWALKCSWCVRSIRWLASAGCLPLSFATSCSPRPR